MPSCRVRVFRTEAQALKEDEHVLNAAETYSAVVDWAVSTFSTPASQWLLFDCSSSNPIGRGALKDCLPEGNCQLELVQTSAAQLKREERISVAPKPSTAEKDVSTWGTETVRHTHLLCMLGPCRCLHRSAAHGM